MIPALHFSDLAAAAMYWYDRAESHFDREREWRLQRAMFLERLAFKAFEAGY
jgi:hypothetical protein